MGKKDIKEEDIKCEEEDNMEVEEWRRIRMGWRAKETCQGGGNN